MKTTLLFSLLLASATLSHANPEIATVIDQEYGAATAEGILLMQSGASAAEPLQWSVFARDPFRPGELVRASLTVVNGAWAPKATGAGPKLLGRVPPQPIAFNRIRFRALDVLRIAQRNSMLAKTNFVTASYQLASDSTTGAPQWGVAVNGTDGREVGFIVISAETGAVIHQQWNNGLSSNVPGAPVSELDHDGKGERAAENVRRAARNAWEWTGDTGLEVGHFFKRLFRSGDN
ncbi:hypothetical protein [Prosthecobacter sp.]|uniref:hypothetical protein n=1 Tax=Prosthecobacter sp. TaxID=1965333 RepID=UPI002487D152|nr:hypothetical protein [Prosthecobacter sp.]MDI1314973.1 hypothetical protein [Prosthecobacter sp.]